MAQQKEFEDFELDLDLTETQAWGGEYQLPPAGDCTLTVVNITQETSSKNNPMLAVTFEIADEGEHKGKKVFNNYSLNQKALGRLKALSIACGASMGTFKAAEHVGQTIRATIIHVEGQPGIDEQGNPRPAKTFANVMNEQPLEEVAETAPPPKPPIANKKTAPVAGNAKATANGAPRRA